MFIFTCQLEFTNCILVMVAETYVHNLVNYYEYYNLMYPIKNLKIKNYTMTTFINDMVSCFIFFWMQ